MTTFTESGTMAFAEVSSLLWRERDALQLLLFKLVEEQLIVGAGQNRWLAQANDEIEMALAQLRGTEVLRSAEVEDLVSELGLTGQITLTALQTAAPEPWATLLAEHRQALVELIAEIERATATNRTLLSAGARAIRETLLSVSQTVQTYDSRGTTAGGFTGPMLMDEQL